MHFNFFETDNNVYWRSRWKGTAKRCQTYSFSFLRGCVEKGGGKRERNSSWEWENRSVAFHKCPDGGWTSNPGMCSDLESNWQTLGSLDIAQPTKPSWLGFQTYSFRIRIKRDKHDDLHSNAWIQNPSVYTRSCAPPARLPSSHENNRLLGSGKSSQTNGWKSKKFKQLKFK